MCLIQHEHKRVLLLEPGNSLQISRMPSMLKIDSLITPEFALAAHRPAVAPIFPDDCVEKSKLTSRSAHRIDERCMTQLVEQEFTMPSRFSV